MIDKFNHINSQLLTNIFQSYGSIQIFGIGIKSVSKIEIGYSNQLCTNIFNFNDNHISCQFYNSSFTSYSTLNITLFLNNTSTSPNNNNNNNTVSSFFGYQYDGCKPSFFFDSINNICKKVKENFIYSYKVCTKLGGFSTYISLQDNLESSICKKGWSFSSKKVIDILHYRYIQYQLCWNIGNLTSYTELGVDFPNITLSGDPLSFIKKATKDLCSVGISTPDIIDLQKSDSIYKYTCLNSFGSEDRIQSSIPSIIGCSIGSNETLQSLDIWLTDKRCLNGQWDSNGECICNESWSGDTCEVFACKPGYSFNQITKSCLCNKTCGSNEILEPISCQCMCNPIGTPIRCDNNKCVDLAAGCNLNNTICNPDKPFKCFNGLCSNSPSTCKTQNLRCLYEDCCWDGSIKSDEQDCPTLPSCRHPYSQRCSDGSCQVGPESCDPTYKNPMCLLTSCPDGVSCPPCQDFNGCPISLPYQCLNGNCVTNKTECQILNQIQNFIRQDILIPVFNKPLPTDMTIQFGKSANVSILDTNGLSIGQIDVFIPSEETKNYTEISVKPVSDSYIRQVTFNQPTLNYDNSVFSPVLNITFSNYKENLTFDFFVNIKFKINITELSEIVLGERLVESLELPFDEILNNYCLGYINETLNQWCCVDSGIPEMDHLYFDEESDMVYGSTNHFTSFALLLRMDPNEYSTDKGGENKQFTDKLVMIVTVVSIVSFVIIGCIIGLVYYSFKKYGNFKTMGKAWKENFRSKIRN